MTAPRTGALLLAVLSAVAVASCSASDDGPPPAVTAQGFDLGQPRTGAPGDFSDLRLRFEVASGIEHLVIRERSYEIDLARSPDVAQLPLFGLERRVWSKHDVTLDFAPYVNGKIRAPGNYAFGIEVTDRVGRRARAELRVLVTSPEAEQRGEPTGEPAGSVGEDEETAGPASPARGGEKARPLGEASFRLERVGRGPVAGAEQLGVTWHTVDAIAVVIRMSAGVEGAGRLARLEPEAYEALATSADLTRAIDRAELADSLDIPTANDAAARTVVAVVRPGSRYVLRTEHSHTSLSGRGTTVTLTGRYRY